MLDHAVGVDAKAGPALRRRLQMREDVHPCRVEIAEPRLVGLVLPVDEVLGGPRGPNFFRNSGFLG
jgi:hypothetical protein